MARGAAATDGHGPIGTERTILVGNSWGADWGLAGHAWLPETYLAPRLTHVALLKEDVHASAQTLAA